MEEAALREQKLVQSLDSLKDESKKAEQTNKEKL